MNEKSMINPFPHFVYKDNKQYRLDLSYRKSVKDENFVWILTYVGDNGILYRAENVDTTTLLRDFDKYCLTNKIVK